jgi:primosomal protein N'
MHAMVPSPSDRLGLLAQQPRQLARGACRVLGPVPAPLEKIRNRWRSLILVKTRPL